MRATHAPPDLLKTNVICQRIFVCLRDVIFAGIEMTSCRVARYSRFPVLTRLWQFPVCSGTHSGLFRILANESSPMMRSCDSEEQSNLNRFEPVLFWLTGLDRFFLPVKYRCSFFRGRLNRQVGINRTFIPILGLPEMGLGSSSAHTKNSSIEN